MLLASVVLAGISLNRYLCCQCHCCHTANCSHHGDDDDVDAGDDDEGRR